MANETGLEAVRERAECATSGPWVVVKGQESDDYGVTESGCLSGKSIAQMCWGYDAEFIAHARTDIPRLLDEIARLQTESVAEREAEMELCCKDVCSACRGEKSPLRAHVVDTQVTRINGKWTHKYSYEAPNVLFRALGSECNAAAIRERWAGKREG